MVITIFVTFIYRRNRISSGVTIKILGSYWKNMTSVFANARDFNRSMIA